MQSSVSFHNWENYPLNLPTASPENDLNFCHRRLQHDSKRLFSHNVTDICLETAVFDDGHGTTARRLMRDSVTNDQDIEEMLLVSEGLDLLPRPFLILMTIKATFDGSWRSLYVCRPSFQFNISASLSIMSAFLHTFYSSAKAEYESKLLDCRFLRQAHTWAPLQLSEATFRKIFTAVKVNPAFLDLVHTVGNPQGEYQSSGSGGYDLYFKPSGTNRTRHGITFGKLLTKHFPRPR
jgi:hypothetical protein